MVDGDGEQKFEQAIERFEDWSEQNDSRDLDLFLKSYAVDGDTLVRLREFAAELHECEERFARLGAHTGLLTATSDVERVNLTASILSYCEISNRDGRVVVSQPRAEKELTDFTLGDTIAERYQLLDKVGGGGEGVVYRALDKKLNRLVALKVERRRAEDRPEVDASREAMVTARLQHKNIAWVFDFGRYRDRPYTTFEFVDGRDLRHNAADRGAWPLGEVQSIVAPLAEALDFAHAEGFVHRDLKPANICLSVDGTPKILDFGIARNLRAAAEEGTFRGTVAYAAPEQAACRPVDGRADQYALGLIAYELLAGRRPFLEQSPIKLLMLHETQAPPRLHELVDIPEAVADAVMKALEKDPNDRFATCREFAFAFSAIPGAAIRSNVSTEVHISLTGGESLIARKLARLLEVNGYRTWYYQRNALPGVPLPRQVENSLATTRSVLLLISRESLKSADFAEEVMSAHRLGRHCLPVLIGMSLEEFAGYQPIWRPALGTATIIELDVSTIGGTLRRVLAALEQFGISPGRQVADAEPARKPNRSQAWATDANQIDINVLDEVVFRNELIDGFLNRRNQYFLAATKGLGKTLLLTYKRRLMTDSAMAGRESSTDAVVMIPKGRPFLDFMGEMRMLGEKHEIPLREVTTCKRLWGAALRISILSHHGSLLGDDQLFELKAFPQRMQRWLKGANVEPTVVFKELTQLSIRELNRLIDDTENFLDQQIRQVHSGTLVFVDKVDQAVRLLSKEAWVNIQAGLIEAAWDLMNANSHVKVFASIRQEAFANYESPIKSNLFGATTLLRYSDQDLRLLVDRLSACYEGTSGYKDFVGVNVIKHPRRPQPEDSFQFLRRYTLGRPRDFVAIASELSRTMSSLDEHVYCDVIRRTSAMGLVANVFDEAAVFLDCLRDRENRLSFLAQLPANILTHEQAVAISAQFNGLPEDSLQHFGEEAPEIFHPFRDLFLTGLLGVVQRNDQDVETQRFRLPDDMLTDSARDLPHSQHYFLHPALSEYIRHNRQSADFRIVQHILVGENAPWHPFDPTICQIEAELANVADVSLRNTVHEHLSRAKAILLSSKPHNLNAEFSSSQEWRRLCDELTVGGNEDVVLWFEELI